MTGMRRRRTATGVIALSVADPASTLSPDENDQTPRARIRASTKSYWCLDPFRPEQGACDWLALLSCYQAQVLILISINDIFLMMAVFCT